MIIGVDFDGTCTTHDFPKLGKDIGSIPVLKRLVEKGHKLILFTMRSDDTLLQAAAWFERNGIELWSANINPDQHKWTKSPKVYCQLYIDDAALGCPLMFNSELSDRNFVDWQEVENMLITMKVL